MGKPQLSARELDCLRLAAEGQTSREIAGILGITERTVRFHVKNVCSKLGVERRVQAVAIAMDRKLIGSVKQRSGLSKQDGKAK